MDLRAENLNPSAAVPAKRIFLDTTFLRHARDLRGIPQVILQLVRLFMADERYAQVTFVTTESVYAKYLAALGVRRERIRIIAEVPWLGGIERFHGLFSTFRYRNILPDAALLIHPELRSVVRTGIPQMICYYDFIIFESSAIVGRRKWTRLLYYRYKNRQAAKAAHKISISAHTRKRAAELFPGTAGAEAEVLHLGIRAGLEGEATGKSLPGGRIQFLYVGSFEARKNIDALLDHLPDIFGSLPFDLHLVGHVQGERKRDLESKIARSELGACIHLHGLVPDEELKSHYQNANFLLFPSHFEGFGLPMVEAMGHGAVVCAFNNSCISEVGGDAIIIRENDDFAGWGERIRKLAADPDGYARLSRAARSRAGHFSETGMMRRYSEYFDRVFASLDPG